MGMITVAVLDATGNRRELVELPDDVPVNRILVRLVEKQANCWMSSPWRSPA